MAKNKENQTDTDIAMPAKKGGLGKLLFAVVILAAAGGGAWWYMNGSTENTDSATRLMDTVRVQTIENTVAASGSLQPSNYLDVGAQVSGQLQKLHVEVGDVVEVDQLLAEIDARVQEEQVKSSRANLESQEAQLDSRIARLELAEADLARQEMLFEAGATSQQNLDNAKNSVVDARASMINTEKSIERAKSDLVQLETELEYTKIYAPVAGTVVSIEMQEGRTLNASQQAPTILQIANLDTMTVETEISEADIGKVTRGMEVYFTTLGNGDRRWYSTLRQILPVPTVTNNVVLYTGLFDVENDDGTLLPEMTTQVYFVISSAENVLTVPLGALTFINENGQPGGAVAGNMGSAPNGGDRPDMSQFGGNGEITDEMRERFQQMRESGNFPGGGGQGGFGGAGGGGFAAARMSQPGERRLANVTVVNPEGTEEVREVVVGMTTRTHAEVVSGLTAGEQVVAGILESAPDDDDDNGFSGRPPMMMFR